MTILRDRAKAAFQRNEDLAANEQRAADRKAGVILAEMMELRLAVQLPEAPERPSVDFDGVRFEARLCEGHHGTIDRWDLWAALIVPASEEFAECTTGFTRITSLADLGRLLETGE